ncbi:MAG: acetyl-CoA carboxylase biotin carboxyl carrier protein [Bacillota bacterium]
MTDIQSGQKRVEVRAPIAGVFYRRPAPEEPPYVEVGDTVKKKQVLCLLETMKVFQKIKSPADGKVVEIVSRNEKPVADSDVLMVLESE